jgi:hypothetical protein
MGYLIGQILGSLVGMFLLSRLTLWIFKRMEDGKRRILLAHGSAFLAAVVLGGLGFADESGPRFLYSASLYFVPTLVWGAVDLLALKGRRAKQA